MFEIDILEIVRGLMGSICHQLPVRSFESGSIRVPLCYRCSSFYVSFMTTLLMVVVSRAGPRPVVSLALGLVFVGMLGVDVFVADSTNLSRVVTGGLAGAGTGLVAGGVAGGVAREHFGRAKVRSPSITWWLAWTVVVVGPCVGPLALGLPRLSTALCVLGVLTAMLTAVAVGIAMVRPRRSDGRSIGLCHSPCEASVRRVRRPR